MDSQSDNTEQLALEFLAAEYERDGKAGSAEHIRTQPLLPNKARAVRAIAAALRQQPAPVVDEAMVERALNAKVRNWPVRQLFDSECEARIAMRSALTAALSRAQGVQRAGEQECERNCDAEAQSA